MTRQTRITTFARFFDACAQFVSTNEGRIRIIRVISLGKQPLLHAEFARNDGRAISGGAVVREVATALLLQPQDAMESNKFRTQKGRRRENAK